MEHTKPSRDTAGILPQRNSLRHLASRIAAVINKTKPRVTLLRFFSSTSFLKVFHFLPEPYPSDLLRPESLELPSLLCYFPKHDQYCCRYRRGSDGSGWRCRLERLINFRVGEKVEGGCGRVESGTRMYGKPGLCDLVVLRSNLAFSVSGRV